MKNVWTIVNSIAWKHGIHNPRMLEGGTFTKDQSIMLRRMQKKCLKSHSADSFYKYIQQKARYFVQNRKFLTLGNALSGKYK